MVGCSNCALFSFLNQTNQRIQRILDKFWSRFSAMDGLWLLFTFYLRWRHVRPDCGNILFAQWHCAFAGFSIGRRLNRRVGGIIRAAGPQDIHFGPTKKRNIIKLCVNVTQGLIFIVLKHKLLSLRLVQKTKLKKREQQYFINLEHRAFTGCGGVILFTFFR